jgi:TonB family protein
MVEPRPSSPASRRPDAIVAPALRVAALLAALLAAPGALAAAAESDQVSKLIASAKRSFRKHDYRRAAELYAKADEAAGGQSLPAVVGLTRSQLNLFRYDDAIAAVERWIGMAGTREARAAAYQHLGFSLHRKGLTERWETAPEPSRAHSSPPEVSASSTPGEESLRAAVDAFRRAAEELGEDDDGRQFVLLNLADSLSWLGEIDEARAALEAYAAAGGADPYADEIRCWVGVRVPRDKEEGEEAGGEREPLTLGFGEVQAPVRVHAPAPQYPPGARAARMKGTIVLQAILTKEGTIECVRPLRGDPYPLAQAAMAAVKRWRFEPARLRGEPVDVYYNLTVNFNLRR